MSDKSEIIHMRIDSKLMDKVRKLAVKEFRSYAGQIEYMLKKQIDKK